MTATLAPVYELWDVEAGNLIADYADEAAALDAVREGVDDEGPTPWMTVALVLVESDGERVPIAQGAPLLGRALVGPDGTIRVGGVIVEPSKVLEALSLLDYLTSPAFYRAVAELRDTLVRAFGEAIPDVDAVRAAAAVLEQATGVPLRVESNGANLALVTPSRALAGVLAVGVPSGQIRRTEPFRAVPDGYAVDVAA